MATELEIKLTLSERDQPKALEWLLAQPEARAGLSKTLVNRYFDTPSAALNAARAALRVRQAGDRYIQTLKTQGEFVDGAHRRQEWEWPLQGPELDLSLLEETPLRARVNLQELQLVFETNFRRQVVMLEVGSCVIEVAIDSGEVLAGGRVMPLHEVEFELKAGEPDALLSWARALAANVPVFLNLVSKAEQGYYLAGIYQPDIIISEASLPVSEWLRLLSVSWLTGSALTLLPEVLSGVGEKAHAAEFGGLWESLKDRLAVGVCARRLIDDYPQLGALQLALAGQD